MEDSTSTGYRRPGALRVLAYTTLTGALLVLAAEASLAVFARLSPGVGQVLAGGATASERFVEDDALGLRGSPAHADHDTRGYRNPTASTRAAVLLLGDSQTYGTGVRAEAAWPARLRSLGIDAYAMAIPGYAATQGLALLDEGLALEPDVVVQAVYAGNDLYDAWAMVHGRGRLHELATADADVLVELHAAEASGSLEERVLRAAGLADRPKRTRAGLRRWLSDHSRLFGAARATKRLLAPPADPDWERRRARAIARGDVVLEDASCPRTILTPAYRGLALDVADPRLAEGERILLRALLEQARRVDAAGARFVVLTIPTKESVYEPWLVEASAEHPQLARLLASEAEFWARLRRALDEAGIAHLDALSALRGPLAGGRATYPDSADGHPNALGHASLAKAVASALYPSGLDAEAGR